MSILGSLTRNNSSRAEKLYQLIKFSPQQEPKTISVHDESNYNNVQHYDNIGASLRENPGYAPILDIINLGLGMRYLNAKIADFIDGLITSSNSTATEKTYMKQNLVQHFDEKINLAMIKVLKKDITSFIKSTNYDDQGLEKKIELSKDFLGRVVKKYDLEEDGAKKILINLGFGYEQEYSHHRLLETLESVTKRLNLEERTAEIFRIISEKALETAIQSYLNVNGSKDMVVDDRDSSKIKMDMKAVYANVSMGVISDFINNDYEKERDKLLTQLRIELDKQALNPLYKGNAFGANFETNKTIIEAGNKATVDLVKDFVDTLLPKSFAIVADTLGVSLSINPVLGGLNLANMLMEVLSASANTDSQAGLKNQEQVENAKIETQLAEFRKGINLLLTSPNIYATLRLLEKLYSDKGATQEKIIDQASQNRLTQSVPGRISFGASLVIADKLQEIGLVDASGVITYLQTSSAAKRNMKAILGLMTNKFPDYVRKIEAKDRLIEQLEVAQNSDLNQVGISTLGDIKLSLSSITDKKRILNGLNLEVAEGEFLIIKGESGFGKTTLLKVIAGLHEIESGEISLGGLNINSIKRYGEDSLFQSLIAVDQFPGILPSKTLRENLEIGTFEKYSDEDIKITLDRLGLESLKSRIDQPLEGLSGGQNIRFGVARLFLRASHKAPDEKLLLILDEPTASLDNDSSNGKLSSAARVRDLINEIHKNDTNNRITIICVTHDEDLRKLADRQVDIKEINNIQENE